MFSKDPFDRERYEYVHSVAEAILASFSEMDTALLSNLLRGEHRTKHAHPPMLFHVNALEDQPLRAKRKPPVREIVPKEVLCISDRR